MLQGQKKSYEAKMEEYEALQLQKKVTTHTRTHTYVHTAYDEYSTHYYALRNNE